MTEQEIQQGDKNQKPNLDSSSFWSPWVVLFFGVDFAALNWWRMGKKRKAIVFLVIFNVFAFVSRWFIKGYPSGVDFEFKEAVFWTIYVIGLILQIFLIVLVQRDQRKFEQSGEIPVPTEWTIIVKFVLATLILVVGLSYCLYDLPAAFGYCGVPRFEDVVYQANLANRTGLEKIFLNRTDFDCNWVWTSESIGTENNAEQLLETKNLPGVLRTNRYHLQVDYSKFAKQGDFIGIYETVVALAQPVTRERFSSLIDHYNTPTIWSIPDTSKYDLHGVFIEARCRDVKPFGNACDIYLADRSMIVELSFLWHGDINMNEVIKQATEKTAHRMLQYNQLP